MYLFCVFHLDMCLWKSENNLQESVFSFHYLDPKDGTQAISMVASWPAKPSLCLQAPRSVWWLNECDAACIWPGSGGKCHWNYLAPAKNVLDSHRAKSKSKALHCVCILKCVYGKRGRLCLVGTGECGWWLEKECRERSLERPGCVDICVSRG